MVRSFTTKYLYFDYGDDLRIWASNQFPEYWYRIYLKDAGVKFDGVLLEIKGTQFDFHRITEDRRITDEFLKTLIVNDDDYRIPRFGKGVILRRGLYLFKNPTNKLFEYSTTKRFELFDLRRAD
jgi:hypothetical protein